MDPNIKKRIVASVQVVPVDARNPMSVEPQYEGPDKNTTGWGVYTVCPEGFAEWIIDSPTEESAMMIGATLAEAHGVQIEAQPWKAESECADGMHSWVGVVGKLDPDHLCTYCGKPYGYPD